MGVESESIRDNDWKTKLAGKQYADTRRGATPSDFKQGDTVLVKNFKNTGKLTPNFDPCPYTVKRKEGNEVTVTSKEGVDYRRNTSHVKAFKEDGSPEPEDNTPSIQVTEKEKNDNK